ncbi:DoxX family protein [Rossellomorea vietnamensis]|uniref:DoxX family protein n=1 Tax=Rossellomorea vietnamensis TaxID=218284 RepID=A0ACD4CBP2_9BACI|nr:DoxX family protein [Rossellomorea vietnamensis]UXH46003.1 DoxX family protein [Rossellomorea vietnamensis]WQI97393.1 DoxX family protein [Rossellomorea vietnamensis]WQI97409.1 DoxX family protein [Rossellomorea vietnamensis]
MRWWENQKVSAVWTVLRIWLGVQWLEAGWHKVNDGFDASGFLQGALANATGDHPAVQGWYAEFLKGFALPNVELFNVLIPWGEMLVGVGLIVGFMTLPALLAGAFMNLNFLLAGTVSTNPILYTAAIILLFTGRGAYYWGADHWMIPYFKQMITQHDKKHKKPIVV